MLASPRAATCGLCVTTSTCTSRAIAASRSPIAAAVAPPTPESTSSKISVGTADLPASTTFIASISRDSSPPDATRASGPGSWPGLAAIRKLACSAPRTFQASGASFGNAIEKRARSRRSGRNSAVSAVSSRRAPAVRAVDRLAQAFS